MKHRRINNLAIMFIFCQIIMTIVVQILLNNYYIPETSLPREEQLIDTPYSIFSIDLKSENLDTVYYTSNEEYMYVTTKDNNVYKVSNPEHEELKLQILESGAIVKDVNEFKTAEKVETQRRSHAALFWFTDYTVAVIVFYYIFIKQRRFNFIKAKGVPCSVGMPDIMSMQQSDSDESKKEREKDDKRKRFEDIAGLHEVKKDVRCLVDFLNNKEKYIKAGAKLPKGVIFYGPPGTGKTLLAKAIAGEAGVSFLSASGSDFVEMYVGVGAKRIREIFQKAKRNAPCILFIDEIDAIGSKRHEGDNGEDRKTINALLTELDGFNELDNVLIIGATNRLEDLDPALVRPGRFTNKYCVPLPETPKERLEVINIYSKNKSFDETVDFDRLSKELIGFSPAKIEALLNEAAIISVQEDKPYISSEHIDKAIYKILLDGHMKEGDIDREKEETRIVAWHEAGHAVIGHLLGKEVTKVTVVPSTSGAGGVTFSTPKDKQLHSVEDINNEVMELYGGRIAELLLHGKDSTKITTGASNDIERATKLIRDSIVRYGMSDKFGMLNLQQIKVPEKEVIENAVIISKKLEEETIKLLEENKDKLEKIANLLLEQSTIYHADIVDIFEDKLAGKCIPLEEIHEIHCE